MNHDQRVYLDRCITGMLADASANFAKPTKKQVSEATENYSDTGEGFDGWLPLSINGTKKYDFSTAELKLVRDASTTATIVSEVAKNVIKHYTSFIVGRGLQVMITSADSGEDLLKVAQEAKEPAPIRKMKENWRRFCIANNFNARARNCVTRAMRDGEVFIRFFDEVGGVPIVRFIDPYYIDSNKDDVYGIGYKNDYEAPEHYWYTDRDRNKEPVKLAPDDVLYLKRNVDTDSPRGIPDFYPVLTNLRRLEKLLVNVSTLAAIQSAIALIRKHEASSGAAVQKLVNSISDGVVRTDPATSKTVTGRKYNRGTILDAPKGVSYDFPAHSVGTEGFIVAVDKELAQVALNFVLPQSWLLASEPTEPLTPGSPVVNNFMTEQATFYEYWTELFWRVQERMGIREDARTKYEVSFHGPHLAVGKLIDEARTQQILQQLGATSPQAIAARFGYNYAINRVATIRHRATLMPGEVAPGDSGNTSPVASDGITKSDNTPRSADSGGGNTRV